LIGKRAAVQLLLDPSQIPLGSATVKPDWFVVGPFVAHQGSTNVRKHHLAHYFLEYIFLFHTIDFQMILHELTMYLCTEGETAKISIFCF